MVYGVYVDSPKYEIEKMQSFACLKSKDTESDPIKFQHHLID